MATWIGTVPTHGPAGKSTLKDALVVIRRVWSDDVDSVCEQVSRLAHTTIWMAHWSEATIRSFMLDEASESSRQQKVLFLACAANAVPSLSEVSTAGPSLDRVEVIGFAAFSLLAEVGECSLENLGVSPGWQRRGIGSRLLAAGLLWCRSHCCSSVLLEVRNSNSTAISFYERVGFHAIGRRPSYYRDPEEAAIQMEKILTF